MENITLAYDNKGSLTFDSTFTYDTDAKNREVMEYASATAQPAR